MRLLPSINLLLPKLLFLSLILFAFSSCTQNNSYDSSADEQEQVDSRDTDPLDFISYSSEAIHGEAVYVPVYSHIYQRNRQRTFNLTATLSIRNTDLESPITISKVFYYDSDGNLVQRYLDEPETLAPLSSTSYVVEEEDLRGGVGANFLVLWEADQQVNKPVIEAVMISTANQQGLSFISVGRTIDSLDNPNNNRSSSW